MIISGRSGITLERRGERVAPSIAVGATYDQDAVQYLNHIGITNQQIIRWYCDAVAQLKSAGLWNLIFAWYPFIGATSFCHSHNAKAFWQYQATFNGSPTHNQNGVLFTVNTQYMDLGFASGSLNQYDNTISFYCNTSTATASSKFDFGAYNGVQQQHILGALAGSTAQQYGAMYNSTNPVSALASVTGYTTALGQSHFSTRANNDREIYRNGNSLATSTAVIGGTVPTANYRLGLVNTLAATLRRYCDITVFNSGLTDAQITNHYRIINQFNQRLNRSA